MRRFALYRRRTSHESAAAHRREIDLVVAVTRSYPAPARVDFATVDLPRVLALCAEHRVSCFLAPTAAAVDPADNAMLIDHVKLVTIRQKFASARFTEDLRHVGDAMRSRDVRWLVIKGPALVGNVYRGSAREFTDLDLLVSGTQLGASIDALLELGSTPIDRNYDLLSAIGSGELALELPTGSMADLHWHPIHELRVRRKFAVDAEAMLARSVPVDRSPVPLRTLDATDTVLHLCLHACLSGGNRLLWLKDIELAVRRLDLDQDELVSRARSAQVGLPVAAMLQRSANLLGAPVPPALLRRLAGRSSWLFIMRATDRRAIVGGGASRAIAHYMARSTRSTTSETLVELGRALVRNTLWRRRADASRPWRVLGPDGQHPSLVPSGDESREMYLSAVRAEVEGQRTSLH